MKELQVKIILRNADESTWTSANPILQAGEIAITTGQSAPLLKVGNGTSHWVDLNYLTGHVDLSTIISSAGAGTAPDTAAVAAALDLKLNISDLVSYLEANGYIDESHLSDSLAPYAKTADVNTSLNQKINVGTKVSNPYPIIINYNGTAYSYNGESETIINITGGGGGGGTYVGGNTDHISVNVNNSTNTITASLIDHRTVINTNPAVITLQDQRIYYISNCSQITLNAPSEDYYDCYVFVDTSNLESAAQPTFPSGLDYNGSDLTNFGADQQWEFSIDSIGGVIGYEKMNFTPKPTGILTVTVNGTYSVGSYTTASVSVPTTTVSQIVYPYQYYSSTITSYTNSSALAVMRAAFCLCSSLSLVEVPNATYIDNAAFQVCYLLTSINLSKVKYIDDGAFIWCGISSITLPACSYIGNYAFGGCGNLSEIYLLSTSMCHLYNSSVFGETPIASGSGSIYVPASLLTTYQADSYWSQLSSQIHGV